MYLMEPQQEKKAFRKQMRARRDAASPDERTAWSESIWRHISQLPAYQAARVAHVFLSIQSEIDTRPIIEGALADGKRVVTPIFARNSTETVCCEIDTLADDAYDIGGFGLRVPRVMRPVEQINFNFTKIEVKYIPYDANHKPQSPVVASYDLATTKSG